MAKRMRRIIFFLVIGTVLLLQAAASAEVSYTYDGSTKTLHIYGTGNMKNYSRYSDTSPFGKLKIKHLIIDEGVTSIGDYAFYNGLTNVNLTCSTVVIPSSVISIGDYAFYGCREISSLILKEGVYNIGEFAFYIEIYDNRFSNLKLYLPTTLSYLSYAALDGPQAIYYAGTRSQSEKIVLKGSKYDGPAYKPNFHYSVASPQKHNKFDLLGTWKADKIYTYATGEYTSVSLSEDYKDFSSVVIDIMVDGTININGTPGKWALSYYELIIDGNKSDLCIDNKGDLFLRLDYDHNLVFKKVSGGVSTIHLPENTKYVEEYAFANTKATVYFIPEGTIAIRAKAFSNLTNARFICLPASLKEIENTAFDGCTNVVFYCPNKTCDAYQWLVEKGLPVEIE